LTFAKNEPMFIGSSNRLIVVCFVFLCLICCLSGE